MKRDVLRERGDRWSERVYVDYPAGTARRSFVDGVLFPCLSYSRTGSDARDRSPPLPLWPFVCRARFSAPGDRQHTPIHIHPSQEFDDDDEAKQAGKQSSSLVAIINPTRLKSRRPTPFVRGNHIPYTCIYPSAQNRQPIPPARIIATLSFRLSRTNLLVPYQQHAIEIAFEDHTTSTLTSRNIRLAATRPLATSH